MPTLAADQPMLSVWQPIWKQRLENRGGPNNYLFSVDDLRGDHDCLALPR